MEKQTPAKSRIVVYLDQKETKVAEKKAATQAHKNIHRWGASVIRKELKA